VVELAEVLRRHWPAYEQRFGSAILPSHRRAVEAILRCRTPALGGQCYRCSDCGREHFAWHSCNHRACPKCGHGEAQQWIEKQKCRLLPVPYFLVTFTVPEELRAIIRANQKLFYGLLFSESAATLQEIAAHPKHLGAELGFLGILHTWSRQLVFHPHVHFVVPGGGLTADQLHWKRIKDPDFFLPEKVLAMRFRNRLKQALQGSPLLAAIPEKVWRLDWVVDCLPVGSGETTLRYLANYVYRTALGSQRILKDENDRITFRFRRSDNGRLETLTLTSHEFIRRFLQHVLPPGFQRVRYFGWMAPAAKARWQRILALLDWKARPKPAQAALPVPHCPTCDRPMSLIGTIARAPP
jgi:hypothetical protein